MIQKPTMRLHSGCTETHNRWEWGGGSRFLSIAKLVLHNKCTVQYRTSQCCGTSTCR